MSVTKLRAWHCLVLFIFSHLSLVTWLGAKGNRTFRCIAPWTFAHLSAIKTFHHQDGLSPRRFATVAWWQNVKMAIVLLAKHL